MKDNTTIMRESFVFYRSFWDSIGRLPDNVQLALFRAVANYGLNQTEPDFTGVSCQPFVEAIFAGIRPQLDANYKRFLNGCRGGAPVGNCNNPNGRKGKNNQESTKNQPNENENENENENVKGFEGEKGLVIPFSDNPEFIETWNELRATSKWRNKTNRALKMALTQLSKYDVRFSIELMQSAIAGSYQGVVFSDTPTRYEQWRKTHPQRELSPVIPITDFDNLYND